MKIVKCPSFYHHTQKSPKCIKVHVKLLGSIYSVDNDDEVSATLYYLGIIKQMAEKFSVNLNIMKFVFCREEKMAYTMMLPLRTLWLLWVVLLNQQVAVYRYCDSYYPSGFRKANPQPSTSKSPGGPCISDLPHHWLTVFYLFKTFL